MFKQFIHDSIWVWVLKAYSYTFRIYKYRVEMTRANGLKEKLPILFQSLWRIFIDREKILFYPDRPMQFHALYKILMFLGYRITSDTKKKYNLAIKWWLAFDGNPFAPEESFPPLNGTRKNGVKLLNIHCNDISKERVSSVFEEVFGYSLSVDPRKYSGKCVMKSNWNALHEGRIIECPTTTKNKNVVYQKLIRNEVEDGLVEDMRVPIFGNKTPFVYLKYRSVKDRFVDRRHTGKKATIVEVAEVLSADELNNIHRFCERIGLDYGEVDVLRDRDDGRIYIVDANNTPSGPTSAISDDEAKVAIVRLSKTFEEAFGASKYINTKVEKETGVAS